MGALLSPVAVDLHQASQSKPEQARASQSKPEQARASQSKPASQQASQSESLGSTSTNQPGQQAGRQAAAVHVHVHVQQLRGSGQR